MDPFRAVRRPDMKLSVKQKTEQGKRRQKERKEYQSHASGAHFIAGSIQSHLYRHPAPGSDHQKIDQQHSDISLSSAVFCRKPQTQYIQHRKNPEGNKR